ncbi:glycoside hydrolase family 3 protein [Agromyces sp. NPDC058136]|uniref:glycoside hydrolase family 3 protein n=1 Tax=Agromyces sp. NPDC058136 TaxID=3346354 RepID=UPI0036DDB00A
MTAAGDPTVRGLVGGVLWPGFLGRSIPDWLRRELDAGLAGAVLFAHNLNDAGGRGAPDAGGRVSRPLAEELDSYSAQTRPLLVGIDEEGGNVTRVDALLGSTLPGAAQLGFVDDLAASEAVGDHLADRSRAVGANVVLGPVADVNTDPRNPVIGVRSFGDDPELVSRHAVAQLRGIQRAGAAACVKHFPGHGDTHLDSHHAMPELSISLDELERWHLPPFRAAIAAGVAAVMTAHIIVPEWGTAPATLNPIALGRLRELGFEGVIITDALDMAAVRESVGAGPGAVQALRAGADLLCISNPTNLGAAATADQDVRDFFEVQHAIFAAIDDGSLAVETVERAAERVRRLAESLQASRAAASGERMPLDAPRLAREAITVDGAFAPAPGPRTVLDVRGRSTLAVDSDADYVEQALANGGSVLRGDAAVPADGPLVVIVDAVGAPGVQRDRVAAVAETRPDAVVVDTGLPGEPLPLPTLHTRAASRLAAEAAAELLERGAGA